MNKFESVEEYIETYEGKAKEYLQQLRNIIKTEAPDCTELINYNIAAYALVDGGKRNEQIMFAGFKNHIGFYPHPSTIAQFWDDLFGFKKAKGSVQFPLSRPLPKKLIIDMINYRLEELKK